MRRSRRELNISVCEALEARLLLAGVVNVDIAGHDLKLIGDSRDNSISLNLEATTLPEFVRGLSGTEVRFSRDFDGFAGIDFGRLDDVYVRMRGGDDTVVIDVGASTIPDDLVVSLGRGDDVLAVLGDAAVIGGIGDDMRVNGSRGDDQISLANLRIRDDLKLSMSRGNDVVTIQQVDVRGHTRLDTSRDDDTVLAANSEFEDDFRAKLGSGADSIGLIDNEFGDRVDVNGQRGSDSAFLDEVDRSFKVRRIEEIAGDVADFQSEANSAIERVEEWFLGVASTIDDETADLFQNQLADLSASFGIPLINLSIDPVSQFVTVNDPTPSVSVLWDQAVQQAVVNTSPGPTIASRAYAMLHTAMYDAWSAYDETAISTVLGDDLQRPAIENTKANKIEAMSFAAFRILDDLFVSESDIFSDLMSELDYDAANATTDPSTPAGVGNAMAAAVLELRHVDGSNQLGDDPDGIAGVPYSNETAYQPVNGAGNTVDLEHWTPEFVPIDAASGTEDRVQQFLTPQWGGVIPFSLASGDEIRPAAPQPFLLVEGTVDVAAATITLADGTIEPITRDLIGTVINPEFIAQTEEVIDFSANLTDEHKLIAEFWEDGGQTSFPPGTWMTFGEFVSARDNHSLDQDAQLFFALGNAVFDSGIATWEAKVFYDYVRPIRLVRELGQLGLIGEFDANLGGFAIEAWQPGAGTQTVLATEFLTYQTPGSDPSPPFSEYSSGHSGFSSSAAEILARFTGSDDFNASVSFAPGESRFEPGITPAEPVTLHWDTFTTAAVEAGISRLYGGIHFSEGNLNGQVLGRQIGDAVWQRTQLFISGGLP